LAFAGVGAGFEIAFLAFIKAYSHSCICLEFLRTRVVENLDSVSLTSI
jgi:hypothetical protein